MQGGYEMRTFLPEILAASISGSVMALVLLGIRRIFRKNISRTWCYYIWLIVLIRLLIPYSPIPGLTGQLAASVKQGVSVWYEARVQGTAAADTGQAYSGDNTEAMEVKGTDTKGTDTAAAASEAEGLSDTAAVGSSGNAGGMGQGIRAYIPLFLFMVWLVPAMCLLLYRIFHFNRFLNGIKTSRRVLEDPDILGIYGKLCEELGIRKAAPVFICGSISSSGDRLYSPMLTGFFRPFLVLPESLPGKWREAGTQQASLRAEYVLRHELVHLKRGDLYYKWLVQAAAAMHWFNPFLLKCSGKISEDCELSCDEAVIRRLPLSGRVAYGDTLVAALTDLNMPPEWGPAVGLCENPELMKER